MLFLFDNCEHLLEATGLLCSAIIRSAPTVTILATSRERIRVSGECAYRLPTLPMPPAEKVRRSDALQFAAVQLFLARMEAVEPNAKMGDERIALVCDICRTLDGIPLAIELAAARVPTLGLDVLRTQLRQRLSLLALGPRDLPMRQRTLETTLSWSFDLLGDRERTVLRRVSVFVDGWTIDAAQIVCRDDAIDADAVVDTIASLVEKSLVVAVRDIDALRYRLLHTTRMFCLAKADMAGEIDENASRHAGWLAALAQNELAKQDTIDPWGADRMRNIYDAEIENLRAAIAWALDGNRAPVLAAHLLWAFNGVWSAGGRYAERDELATLALNGIDSMRHPREAGLLNLIIAGVASGPKSIAAAEEAVRLFETIDDRLYVARSYERLAWALQRAGHLDGALSVLDDAASVYRTIGMHTTILFAQLLARRGTIYADRKEYESGRADLLEALEITTLHGNVHFGLHCLVNLAELEFVSGDPREAIERADEAILSARRHGNRALEDVLLCNRAAYRLAMCDLRGAREDAQETLRRTRNERPDISNVTIGLLARVAARTKDTAAAARLSGFVVANSERLGLALSTAEQHAFHELMDRLRSQASEAEINRHREAGALLTMSDAIEEALALSGSA